MAKKIGLTIVSLFLAYNSIKLVKSFMILSPDRFSLLAIVIAAFALVMMITGVFAFLGFVHPTSRILPNTYYNIKNPQRLNALYEILGVKYFRAFLLLTFYRKEDNKKYFNGTKAGIINFDYQTRQSEFGHLAALAAIAFASIILLFNGHVAIVQLMTVMNVPLNFYPIILQRKHRIQIERIRKRIA